MPNPPTTSSPLSSLAGDNSTLVKTQNFFQFIPSADSIKRNRYIFIFIIILLFSVGGARIIFRYLSHSSRTTSNFFSIESFIWLYLSLFAITFFIGWNIINKSRKKNITIDNKGISFYNFREFPHYLAWSELKCIGYIHNKVIDGYMHTYNYYLFKTKSGEEYLLPITRNSKALFVGNGVNYSIDQALEIIHGPIHKLSNEEQKEIASLAPRKLEDLGKEVGHICYLAMFLMALAVFLIYHNTTTVFSNSFVYFYYAAITLIPLGLSIYYMRHIKNRFNMTTPCILIIACSLFLSFPLVNTLTKLIGKPTPVTFIIVEETAEGQVWQAVTDPTITFTIYPKPEKRIYSDIGTTQTLTIYHSPLALNGMPTNQFQIFWKR